MAARTLKRFIFACITIFFVIAFNFFLFRVMPGDISTIIAKATTSDAVKERLLAEAGVDQPLLTQFWIYLKDLLTGDFGDSFYTYDGSSNVWEIIVGRIPNTVILLLCAEVVAIVLGLIVGVVCAAEKRNKTGYRTSFGVFGALFHADILVCDALDFHFLRRNPDIPDRRNLDTGNELPRIYAGSGLYQAYDTADALHGAFDGRLLCGNDAKHHD